MSLPSALSCSCCQSLLTNVSPRGPGRPCFSGSGYTTGRPCRAHDHTDFGPLSFTWQEGLRRWRGLDQEDHQPGCPPSLTGHPGVPFPRMPWLRSPGLGVTRHPPPHHRHSVPGGTLTAFLAACVRKGASAEARTSEEGGGARRTLFRPSGLYSCLVVVEICHLVVTCRCPALASLRSLLIGCGSSDTSERRVGVSVLKVPSTWHASGSHESEGCPPSTVWLRAPPGTAWASHVNISVLLHSSPPAVCMSPCVSVSVSGSPVAL